MKITKNNLLQILSIDSVHSIEFNWEILNGYQKNNGF